MARRSAATPQRSPGTNRSAEAIVARLRAMASPAVRDGLARFGIPADKALGIPVGALQKLAKEIGRDHALALELWKTDILDARMVAVFLDDPAKVTPSQMERWAKGFDGWSICDTACFHLFDRTPHAWSKIEEWAGRREEFVKRAAFALLASVALHDKAEADEPFLHCFDLIEREAGDERNFVKKAVSWALRGIGKRNPELRKAAREVAERLAASPDKTARWIGKDALRDFDAAAKRANAGRSSE